MKDLMDLGKKVAIAGGKEAMNYFRKSDLNFKNKSKYQYTLWKICTKKFKGI